MVADEHFPRQVVVQEFQRRDTVAARRNPKLCDPMPDTDNEGAEQFSTLAQKASVNSFCIDATAPIDQEAIRNWLSSRH
jgi:hypothetical protein